MPFQTFEVDVDPVREIDAYRVRVQSRCPPDRVLDLADLQAAVFDLLDLFGRGDNALGKKKPRRELRVVAGRTHCDRYWSVALLPVPAKGDAYLKRFFDSKYICKFPVVRSSRDPADNHF